ncbi:MAG: hypothetical protein RLN84_08420 [Rhodospirillaceae bacterium]
MVRISSSLSTRRPSHPLSDVKLNGYFSEVSERFCRYLRPSDEADVFFSSTYTISELSRFGSSQNLEQAVFYLGIAHIEWFRKTRDLLAVPQKSLLCDNIVIDDDFHLSTDDLQTLLLWPHWMLKCIYAPASVMIGKFWRGEETVSKSGFKIPRPPLTFLSIRSAFRAPDTQFLSNTPEISALVAAAEDRQENLLSLIEPKLIRWDGDIAELASANFYSSAKIWSHKFLPEGSRYRLS